MELDLEELDLDMVSGSDGVEVGASGMEGGRVCFELRWALVGRRV